MIETFAYIASKHYRFNGRITMNEQTQAIISIDEKRKFLKNHFRYDTMQSWNKVKSFAAKVKLNNIYDAVKVPSEAFDFLDCQELYDSRKYEF